MAPGLTVLRGRSEERRALDAALDRVREGESAVLLLRGEAGIGKTSLLHYVEEQASDCRVIAVAGVESELELPFAALHQLCSPLLAEAQGVPEHQAQALRIALGAAAGPPPDRFLVALAVLGLLAEVAARQPLVCLVDDAQWLDEASLQVLSVVARRLGAESVLLVLAVRETGEARLVPGLPELTVTGLAPDDARSLLAATATVRVDDRVGERLVAETGGNPLALVELVGTLSEAELAGGFAIPRPAATSGRLEEHYVRSVQALPEPTRLLLLLASADATADPTLLWRAADLLGVGRDAAEPARMGQLLEVGSAVRFRHPLVRSAAYAAAPVEQRRVAHRALAEATDPDEEPDRRIWHLSAAASGPDDAVADELERAADRARARAGLPAVAALLERSATLTAAPRRRADRALSTAEALLHVGAFDRALAMLAQAEADAVDDLQRAGVERLRAEVDRAATSGRDAPVLLLHAAHRLENLDRGLARETYLEAWSAGLVAGRLASAGGGLAEVSAAARTVCPAPDPREDAVPRDLLLHGLAALVLDGVATAAPSLRRAVTAYLTEPAGSKEWLQWGALVSNAALSLWDFEAWDAASARHLETVRGASALAPLVVALNVRRVVLLWAGDSAGARSLGVTEGVVKQATGTRRASYGDLFLAAYEGSTERAVPLIRAAGDEARQRGEGLGWNIADRAAAVLALGSGRYAEAAAAAARAAEGDLGPFTAQALPDLVEAAVRSDEPDLARQALRRLQDTTDVGPSDWAAGLEARSRALVSEGAEAEAAYAEAIEALATSRLRLELARAHLVYGEWLRREGQRLAAREQLRLAHDTFVDTGAGGFAERARRELVATGEKVRRRTVDTLNDLTAQEHQIARLAREGRSNPEIAGELFISARTVEWHLRKVFAKLAISSRKELAGALPARRDG